MEWEPPGEVFRPSGARKNTAVLVDEWAGDARWSWAGADPIEKGHFFVGNFDGTAVSNDGITTPITPIGNEFPRVSPKSDPDIDYSYGNALVNWSRDVLDIELMPWQQFVLREGCSRRNGRFRYRTLLTIVARQNGKTTLAMVRILGGLCLFGERMAVASAQVRATAYEAWMRTYDVAIERGLPLGRRSMRAGGEEFYVNGGRYRIVSGSTGAARGLSGVDLVVMDEIRELKRWAGYAAIDKIRRAKPDSQLWTISTEGDLSSEVLNRLQNAARDAIAIGTDSPIGYFEWSAPHGAHPGKPEVWAMANPALGYTLEQSVIEAEYLTDPPSVFETEVLCRKVSSMQSWVNVSDWDDCRTSDKFPVDRPYVFAMDSGPELRHVSIVAGSTNDGLHSLEAIGAWAGPAALADAETRLDSLLRRWKPGSLVVLDKSPVQASARRIAGNAGIPLVVIRAAEWARACRAFYAAVDQRTVRHPGGATIGAALAMTRRGTDGLVSSVHRLNESADNDAAIAAVLALWQSTQHVEPVKVPDWTAF
jgi:hypothetical protein